MLCGREISSQALAGTWIAVERTRVAPKWYSCFEHEEPENESGITETNSVAVVPVVVPGVIVVEVEYRTFGEAMATADRRCAGAAEDEELRDARALSTFGAAPSKGGRLMHLEQRAHKHTHTYMAAKFNARAAEGW